MHAAIQTAGQAIPSRPDWRLSLAAVARVSRQRGRQGTSAHLAIISLDGEEQRGVELQLSERGTTMKYDVEADWQLLNTCNYRCPYCFFDNDTLGEKIKPAASNEAWQHAFDRSGLTWLLHMTGGEPSVYPDFVDLCARLTGRHLLSINSNMTYKSWQDFARRISPRRVSFINAGFHLAERERKNGLKPYLDNVENLKEAGFQIMSSLVATPEALARFEEAIDLLAPIGMFPIPKVLRGHHEGKWYPGAYTSTERRTFRHYNEAARAFYAPALKDRDERPTVDMFGDDRMLHGTPNYDGLRCGAGRLFFKIEPNGDVFRCGNSRAYGNLLDGTFWREDRAEPCDSVHCYYFCEKYSERPPLSRRLHRLARTTVREVLR